MIDIVFRYDPSQPLPDSPKDPTEARLRLESGNIEFARMLDPILDDTNHKTKIIPFDPRGLGLGLYPGAAPKQEPFAVVLGCSDARVPIEMVFNQGCNDLFVVRVAGNVLGSECLGSIDYAVEQFHSSLRLLVVLGHSSCGAVTAAVDAFRDPSRYLALSSSHPLRAIVDQLFVAVRAAAQSLETAWGPEVALHPNYRKILIGTSVVLNAALVAAIMRKQFERTTEPQLKVVYGCYDLVDRRVRLPDITSAGASTAAEFGLVEPPNDPNGFNELGIRLATSDPVSDLLGPH